LAWFHHDPEYPMSIDLKKLSSKELDALIATAKKRQAQLNKRAPVAQVRGKLDQSRSVWDGSCLRAVCPAVLSDGTALHTSFGSESALGGHLGRFPAA
jgi:hypothetical protein